MITGVTITSIGMPKDFLKSKDDFGNRLTKPALQAAAEWWHEKFLKRHFEPGAANRYKYRTRKDSTKRRKEKKARRYPPARRPLVFTGSLKRQVSRMSRVTGSNKKVNLTMTGPRYVHMYSKGGARPYIAGELTATTAAERKELAKIVDKFITDRINKDKTRSTRRVRG